MPSTSFALSAAESAAPATASQAPTAASATPVTRPSRHLAGLTGPLSSLVSGLDTHVPGTFVGLVSHLLRLVPGALRFVSHLRDSSLSTLLEQTAGQARTHLGDFIPDTAVVVGIQQLAEQGYRLRRALPSQLLLSPEL
jgi:hypothetical protein